MPGCVRRESPGHRQGVVAAGVVGDGESGGIRHVLSNVVNQRGHRPFQHVRLVEHGDGDLQHRWLSQIRHRWVGTRRFVVHEQSIRGSDKRSVRNGRLCGNTQPTRRLAPAAALPASPSPGWGVPTSNSRVNDSQPMHSSTSAGLRRRVSNRVITNPRLASRRTRGEKDDQPHASRHHTRRAGPVRPDHDTTVADRRNGPLRAHTGSDRCRGRCRHRPRRHGLHPPRRVLRQVQRGALPRGRLRPALRSLHRRDRTARDRTVSVSLLRPWAGRLPSSR